jgi:hypothetical protein
MPLPMPNVASSILAQLQPHFQIGLQGRTEPLYRILNGCGEPHEQLDGCYDSFEEAVAEAIAWLQHHAVDPLLARIGIAVTVTNGQWRMLRTPALWLCPLLCPLPA